MSQISTTTITEAVKKLVIEASYDLGQDVIDAVVPSSPAAG